MLSLAILLSSSSASAKRGSSKVTGMGRIESKPPFHKPTQLSELSWLFVLFNVIEYISGESSLAARQFALVLDGRVFGRYGSYLTALTLLFATYYIFNIQYPKEAAVTLEFIQR